RHGGIAAAGLHVPRHRLVLGDRGSAAWICRRPARPGPVGPHAGRAGHVDVVGQEATRKFRRRDEFRDLPDVLRVIRALSAVAREGSKSSALLCVRAQSIHPCGRARPLCTLLPDQLGFARGRWRLHGSVHGRRDPRVRSLARISCAARRAWGRHMRCWSVAMAVAMELALRGVWLAADPRLPAWPSNQIKVPEISVAAVWAGPSIDDVGNAWEEDATIRGLVARLAARRTPLDDAQKAIADVITGTESERQKKAKLLFAGLFKTLNHERSDVMGGIERDARKQKEFSDQIRSKILQPRQLQDRPDPDQGRIEELTNRVEWDTRILEERRKTMNFVCEVPVLIEQRLFALARAIQQSLE